MVANTPMDTDKVKIYGSKVKVDSVAKVAEIEEAEKQKMLNKVEKIIGHGCTVFINRQLVYNLPEQRFADAYAPGAPTPRLQPLGSNPQASRLVQGWDSSRAIRLVEPPLA